VGIAEDIEKELALARQQMRQQHSLRYVSQSTIDKRRKAAKVARKQRKRNR
jgi:hypothetical protein